MQRCTRLIAGLLFAPLVAGAQSPAPDTPAGCSKAATDWFNQTYKAARDKAALPGGTPVDVTSLLASRTARLKTCADHFTIAATSGPALVELSALYSQVGRDSLAKAAIDKRLTDPSLSEAERASALVGMINTDIKSDTLVIVRAEPYMAQLDALSDAVLMQKLEAHNRLNGEYRYLDVDARIRQHSLAIIALGRHLKAGVATPGTALPPGTVSPYALLGAYTNLAEVYGDFGHADSALMILDQARRDHPEVPAKDADQMLLSERERYQLVGQHAPSIDAGHWLNAAPDRKTLDPQGRISVIEFTAHWCIPCRNSYPAMTSMESAYAKRGVQFVFATQFYGYLGTQRGLDAAAEYAADREYYVTEHAIHFPVAIADPPPPLPPGASYVSNVNDNRYRVGGIPQVVIIDRNGIIRRILTGWDTGNAERIPVVLDGLLAGKTAGTP